MIQEEERRHNADIAAFMAEGMDFDQAWIASGGMISDDEEMPQVRLKARIEKTEGMIQMGEFITRLAKAMAKEEEWDWTEPDCPTMAWESYAIAALYAALVPTEAMLEAGRKANAMTKGIALGLDFVPPDAAWRAMLQAALDGQ